MGPVERRKVGGDGHRDGSDALQRIQQSRLKAALHIDSALVGANHIGRIEAARRRHARVRITYGGVDAALVGDLRPSVGHPAAFAPIVGYRAVDHVLFGERQGRDRHCAVLLLEQLNLESAT